MFKTLSRLGLTKLFLLAILLRVLLMPFYFHPDIKTYNFQASFLKKGIINIYSYLIQNRENLPIKEEFVYFPLTYFFLGAYQTAASPLLGNNFQTWLTDASVEAKGQLGVFRYLFLLKLPYLILDISVAFLLIKFFDNDKQKKEAFFLWLFNPVSLAIIYIFSNVDIIPVFLSLLAILLLQKNKYVWSGILLGVAAGFKAYPLIFLPFLITFTKTTKNFLKISLSTLIVLLLVILPFRSVEFTQSALVSGLTTRLVFPGIGIGFGEALMVGIIALVILFVAGLIEGVQEAGKIPYFILSALLLLYSSIHYHIQWLLWIMPFLIIFYVNQRKLGKLLWIWIIMACLIPLLYDDKSMSVSLLSAISPLYELIPTPFLILQHFYDPYLLQGVIHSIMFAISTVVIWKSFKQNKV